MHHQGLRIGACAVDDAPKHLACDFGAVEIFGHGHLQELQAIDRGLSLDLGRACVIALPSTGQANVTHGKFLLGIGEHSAAVGYIVPHEAAGVFEVDGLVDHKGGHVADLAVGVFGQLDVLDDAVLWEFGVQLAKGPSSNLFVGNRGRTARGHWHGFGFVDHDARDAGLGCRTEECNESKGPSALRR